MRSERLSLILITACLLSLGVVMVYGITALRSFEFSGDPFYYVKRQLFFLILGIIAFFFVLSIDYHILQKYSKVFIFIALILLCAVLIPGIGSKIGGARRWFKLGVLNFQPSEFAKLAIIIYLADFLSRKGARGKLFLKDILPAGFVLGTIIILILLEPDLGTAVLTALVGAVLFFTAGLKPGYFVYMFISSLPVLYFLVVSKPYRFKRIISFFNPWDDRYGAGHQIIQSIIALGSGGLFGVGLGHSLQKLYYLPASHTDFIFSIIGEELGLLGTGGVLALFGGFLYLGYKIVMKTKDNFGRFLAGGILSLIGFEVIIHIGVTAAVFPTKGLPLPFVSYGGTNLLFNLISLGVLLNISKNGT